jgi:hypothetical protein
MAKDRTKSIKTLNLAPRKRKKQEKKDPKTKKKE